MRIQKKEYEIKASVHKKICHISDIHYSKHYPKELFPLTLENVQKEKPDYICITGDLIDQEKVSYLKDMHVFYTFLKNLGKCAPTICILGNHDVMNQKKRKRVYENATLLRENLKKIPGLYLLQNEIYEDNHIRFIGYEQEPSLFEKELEKSTEIQEDIKRKLPLKVSQDKYNILLVHSPIILGTEEVQKNLSLCKDIDLILAGHTHDGIVLPILENVYPSNRGIISPNKKLFPKNVRGCLPLPVPIIINGALIKLSAKQGFFTI